MIDDSGYEFWRHGLWVLRVCLLTQQVALGLNHYGVLRNVLLSMTLGYIGYRCAQDHVLMKTVHSRHLRVGLWGWASIC